MSDTATATLDISVMTECPHCECLINLLDKNDTSGVQHDEEGFVLSQAIPDGYWNEAHKQFLVEDVKCSECGHTFDVKTLEW